MNKIGILIFAFFFSAIVSNAQTSQEKPSVVIDSSAGQALTGSSKSGFTSEQDSLFLYELNNKLPFSVRMRRDLDISEALWKSYAKIIEESPWDYFKKHMASLPRSVFEPTGQEIANHEIGMINALSIPGVFKFNPNGGLVTFGQIASFLGLSEDVSPVIKFQVNITADVEVVVYSVQAVAVATLFKGVKMPGAYTYNWNGRDDKGRRMPAGDYIAEIRIGTERFIRKRIVIEN